jgi:hypothetical protein
MNRAQHPLSPEMLMAFLDGEKAGIEEAAISGHLESCSECSALVEQLREDSRCLALWAVRPLPAEAISRMEGKLSDRRVETKRKFTIFPARKLAWVAFALTVPVALFFSFRPRFLYLASQRDSEFHDYMVLPEKEYPLLAGSAASSAHPGAKRNSPESYRAPSGTESKGIGGAQQAEKTRVDTIRSVNPAPPMIERTADVAVRVKDLAAARAAMEEMLARHRGYTAQLTVSGDQDSARSLHASLRVPSEELAGALSAIKGLGQVTKEVQNGEEVTTPYLDLVARLGNARETERRLQEILRTRTGKVRDVLEVEEQISGKREEIERMEAERKTIENRVSFATISVALSEEYRAQLQSTVPSARTRLHNSLVGGLGDAWESGIGLLAWLAAILPTLILWGTLLFFPLRWGWRRVQARLS